MFQSATDAQIDGLLDLVVGFISEPTLVDHLEKTFKGLDVDACFCDWDLVGSSPDLRLRLSDLAAEKSWFKNAERGRAISALVMQIIDNPHVSPIGICLRTVESWLYGNA